MNKKGNILIIGVLVVVVILLLFIRVPYDAYEVVNERIYCDNNILKTQNLSIDWIKMSYDTGLEFDMESGCPYYTDDSGSKGRYKCIDNKPMLVCNVQLIKAIFKGKIFFG